MAADFRINNLIAQGGSFTQIPTVNGSEVLLVGGSTTGSFLTTGAGDLRYALNSATGSFVTTGATGAFLTTGAADLRYVEFIDQPVFQTGNQIVSGTKTFHSGLLVQNGNVGIGTLAPTAKLEVVGDSKISGNLTITNYNSGVDALDRFAIDGFNGRLFGVSDSVTGTIFSVNDAAGLPVIEVESNLTDKITMGTYGSNALVVNDTKVGIGTATPSGKLEVIGDTKISGNLIFTDGGTRTISGASNTVAGAGTSLNIRGGNANTAGVGGSINLIPGIGAGGPGNGDINIGSSALGLPYNINLNAGAGTFINYTGPNVGTTLTVNGGGRELMSFNWDNINNVTSLKSSSASSIRLSGALDYQIMGSTPTSSRAALNVVNSNNSSIAYFRNDGNVGIGTTTPSGKLQVVDSTTTMSLKASSLISNNFGLEIYGPQSGTYGVWTFASNIYGSAGIYQNNSPKIYADANSSFITGNGALVTAGNLDASISNTYSKINLSPSWVENAIQFFGNSNSEKMRISSANGNVGINTTTPSGKLQVNVNAGTSQEALRLVTTSASLNTGSYMSFFSDTAELARIKGYTTSLGANVGQILLNPVYNGTEMNGVKIFATSAGGAVGINTTTTNSTLTAKSLYNGATILSLLDHADVEKFTVLNNGNLGIGTGTPSTKLEILTSAAADGIKLTRADGERAAWLVDDANGIGALYLFNGGNSNSVYLAGNGSSFINGGNLTMNGGNFGIGTGTPVSKLTIRGSSTSEQIGTVYDSTNTERLAFSYNANGTTVSSYGGVGTSQLILRSNNNSDTTVAAHNGSININPGPYDGINSFAFNAGAISSYVTNVALAKTQASQITTSLHDNSGNYGQIYLQPYINGTAQVGLMVKAVTGGANVGINTINPTAKLEVIGNTRISGNLSFPNTGSAQIASTGSLNINVGGSGRINITSAGLVSVMPNQTPVQGAGFRLYDNNAGSYHEIHQQYGDFAFNTTAGNTRYTFYANGNSLAHFSSTNSYFIAPGNFGIGTSTPTAKLDIVDATLAGSASLSGSALNIAQTWNTSGTPTAIKLNITDTLSNASSNLMDLQTSGISQFRVNKSGSFIKDSLEINTSAPGVGGVKPVLTLYRNGSGGDGSSILWKRDGGQELGDLRLLGSATLPTLAINLRNNYLAQTDVASFNLVGSNRSSILFGTPNGVSSSTLSIFNSSAAQNTTGIILGNMSTSANSNVDIRFHNYLGNPHAAIRGLYTAGGGNQIGGLGFLTANGGSLVEAMRITPTNNVGVGTTAPTANFEVVQPTVGVGTISIGDYGTTVTGVNTQFLNTFKAGDTITASGQTITISAVSSNTLMTTSLAVSGVSGAAYSLVGGSRFRVYGNGDMTLGSTSVVERTANIDGVNANRLLIAGNFGFGGGGYAVRSSTINSSSRLVVSSPNNSSATSAYLLGTDGLQRDKGLIYDNSGDYISLVNGSNSNNDSYTRRLTILNNGNVGIGTTTPTEKLDIIGNAKISASLSTNTLGVSGASVFNSSAAFTVRPTVNSSGVLLEGELSTGAFLTTGVADTRYVATGATGSFLTTGVGDARYAFSSATGSFLTATTANALYVELADQPVYQTGTQTISGLKTFADVLNLTTQATASNHAVRADRNFSAGAGLLGGGDLTSNRTFSVDTSAVVTTVGTQTIAGVKTFTERPTVNSSGVLLIGDSATGAFLTTGAADLRYVATGATGSFLTTGAANLQYVEFADLPVFQTGNQTISGVKTFATGLLVQGDIQATSITTSSITTNSATALSLQYAAAGHVAIHTNLNIVPAGGSISINNNTFLTSRGAANFRLGAADAAAPVAQTLSVQSVAAGMTNTAGANLTVTSSQGTGTGVGGSIIFQVAPAGSSGTSQNALIPRVIFPATSAGGVVIAFNALDSSNVALRSTGTTLDIVRADAGAFANLTAQNITAQGTITTNNFAIISNVNVAATTGEQIAFIASTTSNGTAANGFGTRISLRTESSTTANRDSGAIAAVWSDATDATRTSDLLLYNTLSGTLTECLRILGTNGNVGIGTATPSYKLTVNGGIYISAGNSLNLDTASSGVKTITASGNDIVIGGGAHIISGYGLWARGTRSTGIDAVGAGSDLQLITAGAEKVRVTTAGNVGIGTTTPSEKLEVSGGNAKINGVDSVSLTLNKSTSTNSSSLSFTTSGSTNATIQHAASGNFIIQGPNSYTTQVVAGNGGTLSLGTGSNGTIIFSINSSEAIRILTNGNVGIGTSTPTEKLEIGGNAKVSGHFSAATKSFLIPHPTKPTKQLQYACLEGPENGVYIRGKTNESVIILPDYWKELVDEDSVTVTVTPIGKFQQLFVASQTSESVEIGNVDGFYNYVIYGERKDVDKLQTEI